MPDTKISADTAATTTAGAEIAGTQGGANVRIPASLLQQSVRMGTVTQAAHGFVAGDVLKLSGTTWSKAVATSVANATAIAVVESVTTNTFVPVLAGRITLSGLTAGLYYLSDATAGILTLTAPTTATSYLVAVLRAVSATDAYVDIGTPLTLSLIQETDLAFYAAEAPVASASTTDIGAVASRHVSITGTTTITGLGTAPAGRRRDVRFEGILTLTHNATSLILPGGVNITTASGDRMGVVSLGSGNWLVFWYQRASGAPLTATAANITDFAAAARAQVEAMLTQSTNITLTPSGTGASRQIAVASSGGGAARPNYVGRPPGNTTPHLLRLNGSIPSNVGNSDPLHGGYPGIS